MFFFFIATATTDIYTLSLHDALPIYAFSTRVDQLADAVRRLEEMEVGAEQLATLERELRSEEHTSELQSRQYLVCRLLLEKKKARPNNRTASRAAVTDYAVDHYGSSV